MRPGPLRNLCAVLSAWAWSHALAIEPSEPADPPVPHEPPPQVRAADIGTLQESLLALSQERLRQRGLSVDRQRARLSLSQGFTGERTFSVRPLWRADSPSLPLRFELRSAEGPPIEAVLAVILQKDAPVAARRLSRGSEITCADIAVERIDQRWLPRQIMTLPCAIPPGSVMLHDLSTHEAIRSTDVGRPPDVTAGAPVRVTVSVGPITISTGAVALVDAQEGDRIAVRLQRPLRTRYARVTGPGSTQLLDGWQ